VEQPAEEEWPEEVGDGEEGQEVGDRAGSDVEEAVEKRAQVEDDRVVQERLSDEERQTENGATRVPPHRHAGDLPERDDVALPYGHRFARFGQLALGLSAHLGLDPVDDAFRLGFLPVDEQPAWTLRYMPAYQHDAQAQEAAQAEGQPPAEVGRQQILV